MALCLNISLRFLKTKKLSVSLVTECGAVSTRLTLLHMPFGKGQAVVWEWFSRFFLFCVLFVLFLVGVRYEGGMQHSNKRCFYTK